MTEIIADFRSDTVTRPSAEMRQAMLAAKVGDDVFCDDPTVKQLEAWIAERAGKEAALFCTSGTQSNLVALLAHCQRGDEYIVGQQAHTYRYEGGGAAVLGSIQPQPIEFEADCTLDLDKVRANLKPDDCHFARSRLLCLENTCSGVVLPLEYHAQAANFCAAHGLALHLDGARLFNATEKQGIKLDDVTCHYDSISLCISKGLGAPVGSCLVGTVEQMATARRVRKRFGGGMRQAGLLAAACIHALDHNLDRLAEDHAHARLIAEGLDHPRMRPSSIPETNILLVELDEGLRTAELLSVLAEAGVLGVAFGPRRIRLTTHKDLSRSDCERALAVLNGLQV